MTTIKEILKWSIISCIVAFLLYLVLPKYNFMGPNGFAVYRCNTITGEVMAWDIGAEKWVTPSRKVMARFVPLKVD